MKECTTCGVIKDVSAFNKKSSNRDGLERYCKECHRKRNKIHYEKNKQSYIDNANKRKKQKQVWWAEFKSSLSCSMCGESRYWCLDFHHTNPSIKENSVSQMVVSNNSRERILQEVSKCIILCRNCHADVHYREKELGAREDLPISK